MWLQTQQRKFVNVVYDAIGRATEFVLINFKQCSSWKFSRRKDTHKSARGLTVCAWTVEFDLLNFIGHKERI